MGNSVNKTVSKGGKASGKADSECEELKRDVESADQQVQDDIKSGSATKASEKRKLNAHKASTVTSSKSTCGGESDRTPAYSSLSRLPERARSKYAQGTRGGPSNMCTQGGKRFKHIPDNGRSSCNHTEGRLIEDLFAKHAKGGRVSSCTLTMKIKWKKRAPLKGGGFRELRPSSDPCPRCKKTICHAMMCGMKIYLCKEDNGQEKKTKPSCNKQ